MIYQGNKQDFNDLQSAGFGLMFLWFSPSLVLIYSWLNPDLALLNRFTLI